MTDATLRVGIDGSGARQGERIVVRSLEEIKRAAKATAPETAKVDKGLKDVGKAGSGAAKGTGQAARSLDDVRKAASGSKPALDGADKGLQALDRDAKRTASSLADLRGKFEQASKSFQLGGAAASKGFAGMAAAAQSGAQRLAGVRSGLDETGKAASRAGQLLEGMGTRTTAGLAAVSGAIFGLKGAMAGLGLGLITSQVLDASLAFERVQKSLKFATGSAQAGAAEFQFVREAANTLGLELRSTAESYAQFAAAAKGTALEGQAARAIFLGVAEGATVLSLSTEKTERALTALQQMISKGSVASEELKGQLGEALPGAFQMAARAMGVTTKQLQKMLDNGEVAAADLLPKLALELHKTFGPELAASVDSAQAKINRFKNVMFELKVGFANSGFLDGFTDALGKMTGNMSDPAFQKGMREFGAFVGATLGYMVENASTIVTVLSALAGLKVGAAVGGLAGPGGSAVGGVLGAAGGAAGAIALMNKAQGEGEQATQSYEERLKSLGATFEGLGGGASDGGAIGKTAKQIEALNKRRKETIGELKTENGLLKVYYRLIRDGRATENDLNDARELANTLRQLELDGTEPMAKAIANEIKLRREQSDELAGLTARRQKDLDAANEAADKEKLWRLEAPQRAAEANRKFLEREAEEQAELMRKPFENAIEGVQDSFTDFFESVFSGGVKSFKDLAGSVKSIFIRLAGELASLMVIRPMLANVMGGGGGGGAGSGWINPDTGLPMPGAAGSGPTGWLGSAGNAVSLGRMLSGGGLGNLFGQGGFQGVANFANAGIDRLFGTNFNVLSQADSALGGSGGFLGMGGLGNGLLAGGGAFLMGMLSGKGFGRSALSGATTGIGAAVGGLPGAMIGGLVGSLLGGLFKKKGRKVRLNLATHATRDESLFHGDNSGKVHIGESPFGFVGLSKRTKHTPNEFEQQFPYAMADADKALAEFLSPSEVARVAAELQARGNRGARTTTRFNMKPQDVATVMKDRLGAIIGSIGITAGARDTALSGVDLKGENAVDELLQKTGELLADRRGILDAITASLTDQDTPAARAKDAIDALNKAFDDMAAKAPGLGIALADVEAARVRERAKLNTGFRRGLDDTELALTDPKALALRELDRSTEQMRAEARELGIYDKVKAQIDRIHELQLDKVLDQFADATADATKQLQDQLSDVRGQAKDYFQGLIRPLSGFRDSLHFGSSSPRSIADQLASARSAYSTTLAGARKGEEQALADLPGIAQTLLGLQRDFDPGAGFRDLFTAVDRQTGGLIKGLRDQESKYLRQIGANSDKTVEQQGTMIGHLAEISERIAELNRQIQQNGDRP